MKDMRKEEMVGIDEQEGVGGGGRQVIGKMMKRSKARFIRGS